MPGTYLEDGKPTIMIVGMGDLSCNVLTLLAQDPDTNRLVLAGRDVETVRRRANLVRFTAHNLGHVPEIEAVGIDLDDIDATAETLARVRPDIVFMGASLQSWRVITGLPAAVFEALDEAQFGPWLPMHLTLNYKLMQAVRRSGVDAKVVNAAFPDAVGPVLAKVGLAPTIGIGNVANIIPALTYGVAHVTGKDVADVELRLVAQHYFSHYVPRFGDAGRGAYHLTARVGGQRLDGELDHSAVFSQLNGRLKRLGGVAGQLLTASSAVRVVEAMATDSGILAHAPAPDGLPGGYPVRVYRDGGVLDLDESLDRAEAIRINEDCQRADGIEAIEDDGTVVFTEPEMAIMKSMLGYECRRMALADVEDWAEELGSKYRAFADRYS
ncbi:hypothetical protein [Salinarimonas ramus]|uniref:Saccharopine dehydrogenase NADP binding domain-containing protein n=1 Tax=Salinarimonas ramus TaxID=690164 RepID=A0A917QHN7_9HYPH|nr:hypothetical protein [Salinarimonas ramus]GGK49531.1 hypothetical protein GCM10011322_40700 [Salinarimonas ramus]